MALHQPRRSASQKADHSRSEPAIGREAPAHSPAPTAEPAEAPALDRAPRGPISHAGIAALQRTHGNQFTQRALVGGLVQRFDKPLLKAGAVQQARSWYASRKEKYTPAIIKQIQQQVGASVDGLIGPETIQAVAVFQSNNSPLVVDGIAGPATLPALFPSGLAEQDKVDDYVEKAKAEVQGKWDTLATPEARAGALADEVNKKLTASGAPACNKQVIPLDAAGQFDFTTWTLQLGQQAFAKPTITDAEAADAADTVYHEARHAEQWHKMARLMAGQKKTAAEIVAKMGIPAAIAADAVGKPLAPGSTEALIAQGWFDSVYGKGAVARNQTLTELESAGTALEKANEKFAADPSEANKKKAAAAQLRFDKAHAAYMNLPEEADAWRVGGEVTAAYNLL
jgi:hypothetical protein